MAKQIHLHPAPSGSAVGEFITPEGLEQLARFEYVAGPYTLLDNVLNPWWLFVAKFVPRWVSPNAVTLAGLLASVAGTIFTMVTRTGPASTYIDGHICFAVIGVGIFIYQTLDAVDGKHARNTGQATPLGALFDHGCDCVVTIWGTISLEIASSTPETDAEETRTVAGLVAFLAPAIAFYAAQWEHLYTHKMPAGGVTEAQYCGILTMFVAAKWGPALFQSDASSVLPAPISAALQMLIGGPKGVLVKRVMCLGTTIFAFVLTCGAVARCVKHASSKCLPCFLVPLFMLTASCCMLSLPSGGVFHEHRLLCYSTAGLVIMDLNIRMVIAAVCEFKFPLVSLTMLPFGVVCFCIGILEPALGMDVSAMGSVNFGLVFAAFIWQLISVSMMVSNSINRVCSRLQIPFLAPIVEKKES